MGFKGSKRKVLVATLGSFLLFQQPMMTVVEASEMLETDKKTTKVMKKEHSTSKAATQSESEKGTITVTNGDQTEVVNTMEEAVKKVQDNGTITIGKDLELKEEIVFDKKNVTITSAKDTKPTITKSKAEMKFLFITDGTQVTLKGDLTFDGKNTESHKAMVDITKEGHLVMEDNVSLQNAKCAWENFATVYNAGTFDMKGGQIKNGDAARNAGVVVADGATFNLSEGTITENHVSHTEAAVSVQGTFNMTGGTITGNYTQWANGGVSVTKNGVMNFKAGLIENNRSENNSGITVSDNAQLNLGKEAKIDNNQLIMNGDKTKVRVTDSLTSTYSVKNPLQVVVEKPIEDRVLFTFDNETAADKARPDIQVKSMKDKKKLPLVISGSDKKALAIASKAQMADLDVLNNPYTDHLGFEFRAELTTDEGRKKLKAAIDSIYNGVESEEKKQYEDQLNYLTKQYQYITAHKDEVKKSVQTLSQLGNPWTEARRTQQSYLFDNLDITGFYAKPGQMNKINVYVDAKNPDEVELACRQTGITETNHYQSLSTHTYKLKNGWNEISIDLTNNKYGQMLYFRNNSTDNPAKVRIEGQDANQTKTVAGNVLGQHSYFVLDKENPEQFYDYIQQANKQAEAVEKTKDKEAKDRVQDMTIIQTGDTQLAMRASLVKKVMAEEGIHDQTAATKYVQNLADAMDERLDYFWHYAGFSPKDTGVNKTSDMRLYVAFTQNVTNPSTMYAISHYYHMPEYTAKDFMSGSALYGWGMSHEYGHMLDNSSLVVGEETNNMYSLWGSRKQAQKTFKATGKDTFDVYAKDTAYHPQMKDQSNNMDKYLAARIQNPKAEGGFLKENGFFKVMTWFLGTHYFDDWDYTNYDFSNSPYTKELAEQVKTYGAYGTALRLMRSEQGRKIDEATNNKYYRMVIAFTVATGYNFAQYMDEVGETDIPENIKAFCAKYPDMPRKVQYFSLNADGKQAMGYQEYSGKVEPKVVVTQDGGEYKVTATMPTEEQEKATVAYELYQDGKLVDFSRDGKFTVNVSAKETPHFAVKAYDFRLNPSRQSGDKTSLKVKDVTITQGNQWNNKEAFVSATDEKGNDVDFEKVKVTGSVNPNQPGEYELTFEYNGEKQVAKVTVKEKEATKPVYHKDGRYASVVKDDYTLWNDLDFNKKKGSTKSINHQTVKVKGYYTHPNGSTYASLYDKDDKWLGYVNAKAVEYQKNAGGKYYSVKKYAAVVKNDYTLWGDFDFKKKKGNTKSLYKGTVYVKGEYHHFNGSTYASLYDKDDKWLGYVNAKAVEYQKNAGGKYYSVKKYAAVVKNDYTLWGDFDFKKKKGNTKSLYKDTVYVKGEYHHFNGSTYASLYDKDDKWLGYVNAKAVEYQKNAGGKYYSVKKNATVVKNDYTLWSDFDFKKKKGNTKSLYKKTVYIKGEYHHFNGSTYATIYDKNDQWLGYVNINALNLK